MTILIHETAPGIALLIIKSRIFQAGTIIGDSGVNAEIVGHVAGPYNPDQAAARGAILKFEWLGPVSKQEFENGYPPDVLYDQHPHRAFIPVGSTKYLRLIDVELRIGVSWRDLTYTPERGQPRLLTKWCSWIRQWEEKRIGREVVRVVNTRPLVMVGFPTFSPYEKNLRNKFPNVAWPN